MRHILQFELCWMWDSPFEAQTKKKYLLRYLTRAGPGRDVWTPPLTRLLGHVATRGKWHSKERHKSWRNCFSHCLGQVEGQVTREHQSSYFDVLNIFFFYKSAHNSETKRTTTSRRNAFDSPFNALSLRCPQILLKVNVLASREQNSIIAVFTKKRFWGNNFLTQ